MYIYIYSAAVKMMWRTRVWWRRRGRETRSSGASELCRKCSAKEYQQARYTLN
jgi:hypothetical protein